MSIYAFQINLEYTPSLNDCKSNDSSSVFYCSDSSGNEYLVKGSRYSFSAIKRSKDGKLENVKVNEIYDDDGDGIYIAPFNRGDVYNQEYVAPYSGNYADYADKQTAIYNTLFSKYSPLEIDPKDKEISKFVGEIKNSIEKKKKHYDDVFANNKLSVKLSSDENLDCSRKGQGKDCPMLSCGKDSSGNDVFLLKDKGSNNSYFEVFAFNNGSLGKNHSSVESLYAYNGEQLLSKVDLNNPKSSFKNNMLVPAKYKNNPELFPKLLDYSYSRFLKDSISSCNPKIKNTIDKIIKEASNDRINAEMIQLIDFANGNLESNYVNQASLPDYACIHEGVYYNPSAYKKSLEIQNMSKKTISMEQAQELLEDAKAREDIPWSYTFDGCYARAHLMARMFEESGVHVDKAWIRGSLQIPGESPQMKWGYHVAPLVYVEKENGEVQEMIIDPAISDTPLTPKEWASTMEVDFSKADQVAYPTPTNTAFFNKTSFAKTSSDPYWPILDLSLTEENKLKLAEDTMKQYSSGLNPWGEEYEQW